MNIHIAGIMIQSSRLVEARNCWMEAAVARAEKTLLLKQGCKQRIALSEAVDCDSRGGTLYFY